MTRKIPLPRFLVPSQENFEQMITQLRRFLFELTDEVNKQVQGVGDDIASASTIKPDSAVHHVTGTTTISTITVADGLTGPLWLIADGNWSTDTGGNIAIGVRARVGEAILFIFDEESSKWHPSKSFQAGQVVQEVIATDNTESAAALTTPVNTTLTASITPKFSDSVIEAVAIIPKLQVRRIAGTIDDRTGRARIRNDGDNVDGEWFYVGRNLEAASANAAVGEHATWVHMRQTVDSTSIRTYVLQLRTETTSVEIRARGDVSVMTMRLREIVQ